MIEVQDGYYFNFDNVNLISIKKFYEESDLVSDSYTINITYLSLKTDDGIDTKTLRYGDEDERDEIFNLIIDKHV